MPTYRVLSQDVLQEWNERLDKLVLQLVKNPTEVHLGYVLMEIFEYVQIYASYKKRVVSGSAENITISFKDIKDVFSSEDERSFINLFKQTADDLRHVSYKDNLVWKMVSFMLDNKNLTKKLVSFAFTENSLMYKLFSTSKIQYIYREIYEKSSVRSYLVELCNNLLQKYTVGEVLNKMTTEGYSVNISREVLCKCIANQYLVK